MDRRSGLRECASSRPSRRRVQTLGCESLVRQDRPNYPRQGATNTTLMMLDDARGVVNERCHAIVECYDDDANGERC